MAVTLAVYVVAALAEIAGCFAVWTWLRAAGSPWWLLPGAACLGVFAFLLTKVDSAFAGRAFAAYGGVYIATSLAWLGVVEQGALSRWDALGAALCVGGAAVIVIGPRLG